MKKEKLGEITIRERGEYMKMIENKLFDELTNNWLIFGL